MLGQFQQSEVRLEVPAPAAAIRHCFSSPEQLRFLVAPGRLSPQENRPLQRGDRLTFQGPGWSTIALVDLCHDRGLRLLLHGAIDGYQEWSWGDGWVQSVWVGVSVLPLGLIQSWQLGRLQQRLRPRSAPP
jgi:hypothetical protein